MLAVIPAPMRSAAVNLPPVKRFTDMVLRDLKIPRSTLSFITYPTRFDTREAERALKGSKIEVPHLDEYAWRIWDYWERHLDPDLFVDRSLRGKVENRVVLITGGSSGIGKASALKVAEAGGKVIIVARGEKELHETRDEIIALGGKCWAYTSDLTDLASCDELVKTVLHDHKHVDVLINNAGRSIRRSVEASYDRFHDFERTMQLNYFGAVRVAMGLLPAMVARGAGQVISISSIGVLTNAPRFSAYVASKAALEAWANCAAAEFADLGIKFTTINMPLVRTPMTAATGVYRDAPALTPDEAAQLVVRAIIEQPVRIATEAGTLGMAMQLATPQLSRIVLNTAYRLSPDEAGPPAAGVAATPGLRAMQHLLRGVHL
jgi:NAD(P)-dependent dehydrogenase (short-subunit alcohol dehydrogenase family)